MQFVNISTFKADYYVDYCATLRGTLPVATTPAMGPSGNSKFLEFHGLQTRREVVSCSFHKISSLSQTVDELEVKTGLSTPVLL